jgi:hypothetical protein
VSFDEPSDHGLRYRRPGDVLVVPGAAVPADTGISHQPAS